MRPSRSDISPHPFKDSTNFDAPSPPFCSDDTYRSEMPFSQEFDTQRIELDSFSISTSMSLMFFFIFLQSLLLELLLSFRVEHARNCHARDKKGQLFHCWWDGGYGVGDEVSSSESCHERPGVCVCV